MQAGTTVDALNRLLQTLYRSLPMYLVESDPWAGRSDNAAIGALRRIAADQQAQAVRVASLLEERRIPLDFGEFPMEWTDLNFLSIGYVRTLLVESLQQQIASLSECVADLRNDPRGRALAEEAVGAARAHLESLEELPAEAA